MSNVITVSNEEEYKKALSEVKGAVALEFTAVGCPACDEEIPEVDALSKTCGGLTIIRADADALSALADSFKCDATPTIYFAKKAVDLVPGKALELEDSAALKKKMKCAR